MNTIVFDVDGTICPIKKENEDYKDLIPNADMINKIRELKQDGYRIVFFTARNMRTYNGDIDKILKAEQLGISFIPELYNIITKIGNIGDELKDADGRVIDAKELQKVKD